jgi:PAS domain S-box-containing protein
MVLLWGPDGVMIYNDAYSEFAGGRHPRLLGAKVLEGWPEVADFNRHVMAVGLSGESLSYQDQQLVLHRHNRPEQVWMDLYYSPVIDEGKPGGVLAVVVETTERVLAQERLSFALEGGGGVGTWHWDIRNDRIYANAQFSRLFSVDEERGAEGASIQEFVAGIHPDDREWVGEKIGQAVTSGSDFSEEYRVQLKDGTVRWLSARGRAYLDSEGRPTRFPGVVFDITDRKTTELALQNSEERFRAMFAQAPVGMALTTRRGAVLEANDAFLTMLGRTLDEVTGSDTAPLTHPDDVEATRQFLAGLWSGAATTSTVEKRYFHKQGHTVWAEPPGPCGVIPRVSR